MSVRGQIKYISRNGLVCRPNRTNQASGSQTQKKKKESLPSSCNLCGSTVTSSLARDPLTGRCTAEKTCSWRRSKLDDETIEFLGLVPKKSEDSTQ